MHIEAANEPEVDTDSADPTGTLEPRDRNVYILGAGFSAPAGAPLIHDFLDRSRSFLDAPSGLIGDVNLAQREPFQTVFRYKRDVSRAREKVSIDLDNIEELFGLAEISSRLDPAQQRIRDSTALMIARTLQWATQDVTRRPKVRIGAFPDASVWSRQAGVSADSFQVVKWGGGDYVDMDIYAYFAAVVAGLLDDRSQRRFRRDSVITFNYDLVLDYALYQVGVAPDYHLASAVNAPHWKPSLRTCSLLKLHGSTNWGVCSKCRALLFIAHREPITSPLWYPHQRCAGCKDEFYQPLLVPPSWDKSGHRDILTSVWAKAVQELKTAKRICVIGYSMPKSDAFFRYLITLALAENDRLSDLIVVDKGPTVEARWRELLEPIFAQRRFDFHREGLTAYLLDKENLHQLGRGEALEDKTVQGGG